MRPRDSFVPSDRHRLAEERCRLHLDEFLDIKFLVEYATQRETFDESEILVERRDRQPSTQNSPRLRKVDDSRVHPRRAQIGHRGCIIYGSFKVDTPGSPVPGLDRYS